MRPIIKILILCALVRNCVPITLSLESSDNLDEPLVNSHDYFPGCAPEETLDLSDMGLRYIRPNMLHSKTIHSVNLKDNDIKEIPHHTFKDVFSLTCLDISRNNIPIEKLMDFGHQKLKALDLAHQHNENPNREWSERLRYDVTELATRERETLKTTTFSNFPNLQYLDLSGNKFYRLPQNFSAVVPRLSHLYLTNRDLTDLSDHIFSVLPISLKSLHLEKNNIMILEFPPHVAIEALFLDHNPLISERHYLSSSSIKVLSLSNCTLHKIQNGMEQQRYLYNNTYMYGGNWIPKVTNLPGEVPNLEILDLSWNRLHNIDDVLALMHYNNLSRLSLSHNNFEDFPIGGIFPRLEILSLSYNKIGKILNQVEGFPALKVLNLRGNQIQNIQQDAFSNMILETLDLSYNRLKSLPAEWLHSLHTLQYLDLRHNEFTEISDMFGQLSLHYNTNLRDVYVKSSALQKIDPRELEYLPPSSVVHVC